MPYTGGYLIEHLDLLRADHHRHTADLINPISKPTLDALNAVQATPWRINRWVLDVMAEAHDKGFLKDLLPIPGYRPALKRLPDDVWAAMPPEAQREHGLERRKAWDTMATETGKAQSMLDQLTAAQVMRDKPSIWFPHVLDFRHRIYPVVSSGPHPQGDDRAKALLMFSAGLPLGPDGLFWLCVRAANCAGRDKLPLVERVEWTMDHDWRICAAAAAPFADLWWTKLEEPWQFLATCYELAQAWAADNPDGFVSHLPIPQDGSCNGLQHLSAMALDPAGAAATNLTPGPRRDIYQEVAERVAEAVAQDDAAGAELAGPWLGLVSRKVVKRAVMTTPYGVTSRGIRMQLLNDGLVPGEWEDQHALAGYLGGHIEAAIGATVEKGRAIMGWLQDTAHALAKAGHPFEWTTPTGSRCRQSYYKLSLTRAHTVLGRFSTITRAPGGTLAEKKQANGASPNYVHSFDAAHLALTVNTCVSDGMRSFSMIHDSYGAHACYSTALAETLRREFTGIYKLDWVGHTWDEIRRAKLGVDIPEPPPRGTFDISQVGGSEFFFS